MVNPVHFVAPEDDPDRTELIPSYDPPTRPVPRVRPSAPRPRERGSGLRPRERNEEEWRPEPPDRTKGTKRGRHRKAPRKQPLWRELLVLFTVAIVLTILIQHFLGRVYSIPSGSMEQTLHGCTGCNGDRVLVDKIVYRFRDPSPGDVIVFKGPDPWTKNDLDLQKRSDNAVMRGLQQLGSLIGLAPPDERDFVKRVIATGGQTVECCDAQNRVVVDGRPLNEPYIYWVPGRPGTQASFPAVQVPAGTLWVMGDNRNDSCDSRCQGGGAQVDGGRNGVVPVDNVIGKARFIVLPPSRWQGVGDHNPQAGVESLSAADWQQGLPTGAGFLAALPVWWLVRRRPSRRR